PDIVVDRVTPGEFLQPTADLLPQLSEAEWLANMPGTAHEKKTFLNACGGSCHGFQMQMRARFDEASWRKIVTRIGYQERILVQPPGSVIKYDPATKHYSFGPRVANAPAEGGTGESGVSGDRFRNED